MTPRRPSRLWRRRSPAHRCACRSDAPRGVPCRRPPPVYCPCGFGHRPPRLLLLAFLAEDVLARVFDALALVGFGRTEGADLGRDLADLLFVDAGHDDFHRPRRRDRDAFGDRIDDVVAVPERDLQILALYRRTVADAGDFETPLEPVGNSR